MITLGNARVCFDKDILTISTGKIARKWAVTNQGLKTISLEIVKNNLPAKKVLELAPQELSGSDFQVTSLLNLNAKLVNIETSIEDDNKFTSQHLQTVLEFEFAPYYMVKYIIWTYPNADGFRTQLMVKAMESMIGADDFKGFCDSIKLPDNFTDFTKIGYYSDTQNRNEIDTEILYKSSDLNDGIYANIIAASDSNTMGIIMVKENAHCVNTTENEIDSGEFMVNSNNELLNTGFGWQKADMLSSKEYKKCFASWLIAYEKLNSLII